MKCTNTVGCGCDADARDGCPYAEVVKCPYCQQPDAEWSQEDLARGRRENGGCIEYHCYAGYCMD